MRVAFARWPLFLENAPECEDRTRNPGALTGTRALKVRTMYAAPRVGLAKRARCGN